MAGNGLIKKEDQFAEYKYKVTEFFIIINGETDKFPVERISDWKINHYFEEASFPILKFNLMMEPSRYYKIIKNKNNTKFKVRIQSYFIKDGNASDKSMMRDIINDTFVIFTDENNDDYDIDEKKEAKTDKDENELDKVGNNIELFLFKDNVTKIRSTNNFILESCDLTTAVTYLLGKAGVSKVLMSPFDNTKSYPQLILPPQSIEKQLKYLNSSYGFHRKGSLIYFGLFHTYVLDYKGGCTAWYKKEYKETNIYVLEKTNHDGSLGSNILKPNVEQFYVNVLTEGVDIQNNSLSANNIQGVKPTVVNMRENSTQSQSPGISAPSENETMFFNNSQNEYLAEAVAAYQQSNNIIITIEIENVNIEAFNPNKKYNIIFENTQLNQKYKGTYRISEASHHFTNNGDDFILTSSLTFKKVN